MGFIRISTLLVGIFLSLTTSLPTSVFAQSELVAPLEPIVANVPDGKNTLIQVYDPSGVSISSFSLPTLDGQRIVSGHFSGNSAVAIFAPSGGSSSLSVVDLAGTVISQVSLPDGKVNTIFSADIDASGFDDFIAIQHVSSKTRAIVLYDPGVGGTTTATISFPSTALYYSPAYAGKSVVGFFMYNPEESPEKAAAKARRNSRKKKAPKPGKGGKVQLLDLTGSLVASYKISKPMDGQIYPFSNDGTCGFAIRSGKKVKTYSHAGAPISTISLSSISEAQTGDFNGSGLVSQMLVPDGATMNFVDLITGAKSSVAFTGFPDQQATMQAEIDRLRRELLDAFKSGAPISEMTKLRNQIVELEDQKRGLGSLNAVSGRFTRLFTGGVGSIEGVCDEVRQKPNDGYGGFLVKNADKDGKAVYLTPGGKNFYGAELLKFKSYKVVAKLKDGGYGNPDSNGYRRHFRGSKTVQGYGKTIFRAYLKASYYDSEPQKHCWFITNPSSRID